MDLVTKFALFILSFIMELNLLSIGVCVCVCVCVCGGGGLPFSHYNRSLTW